MTSERGSVGSPDAISNCGAGSDRRKLSNREWRGFSDGPLAGSGRNGEWEDFPEFSSGLLPFMAIQL